MAEGRNLLNLLFCCVSSYIRKIVLYGSIRLFGYRTMTIGPKKGFYFWKSVVKSIKVAKLRFLLRV